MFICVKRMCHLHHPFYWKFALNFASFLLISWLQNPSRHLPKACQVPGLFLVQWQAELSTRLSSQEWVGHQIWAVHQMGLCQGLGRTVWIVVAHLAVFVGCRDCPPLCKTTFQLLHTWNKNKFPEFQCNRSYSIIKQNFSCYTWWAKAIAPVSGEGSCFKTFAWADPFAYSNQVPALWSL